ncbi:ATP-grasp domain-containing protein [Umezawaea sp. Da 62-37]|uniref:ATP-grasp domain-containing protein n=1 Tax=Umezawaea sp. Da 62-37 TaxID=3075927 RepID=UPI0028F74A2F|nr:ATP-grasp domain-containing protein [Umezawaea sp. Da 62-37]WNV84658.1 ATP-grasp domain-containing protein [Umezawaea sp. Da 62-37]
MLLLVPSDPLRPNRPDEHFAAEAVAARAAGVAVGLVDHDLLVRGEAGRAVVKVPAGGDAVYRGWMVRGERYAEFVEALGRKGVSMRTSAEQYRRAHELPGWYGGLAAVTPESVWTAGFGREGFDRARERSGAGPVVLRDYVKSMKHYWHEAAFIPEAGDGEAAWAVARRFVELRGDEAVGGFVLRRFERFTSAEVRTWWVDGRCALVGPHPDTPDDVVEPDLGGVADLVRESGLPFVAVDLVRRDDGRWRVVELGDGQVSDRPTGVGAEALIGVLLSAG